MRELPNLPGGLRGAPSAAAATASRLEVFAAGPGSVPWRWSWDGSSWADPVGMPPILSGIPDEGLCAVSSAIDRVELFAAGKGVNTPLWWRGVGGNWTVGPPASPVPAGQPPGMLPQGGANLSPVAVAAVCKGPNFIDVFAPGAGNTPWWWHWNGNEWSVPFPLPQQYGAAVPNARIAAVAHTPGLVDVFAVGQNNHLWRWGPHAPGVWYLQDLGGDVANGSVSAVSWGPGRIDVFAASAVGNNPLLHWWSDGGPFVGPEDLGGRLFPGAVSAVAPSLDRLHVFGITANHRLAHWQWDGIRWNGPDYHGENLAPGDLSAVRRVNVRQLDVFTLGPNNSLHHWPGGGLDKAASGPWRNWPTNRQVDTGHLRPDSLGELVDIVKQAGAQGATVRAVGSSWSNSDVAVPSNYVVETDLLGSVVTGVLDRWLNPAGAAMQLVHVEAGIKLHALNTLLDARGLSLMTMGGSSGQSLAGALSTGVHGMDLEDGRSSLAQMVRAIHLVAPDGAQHWIEPASGITDDGAVTNALSIPVANVHHDDEWFNSVLVSVGSMGIIYSVVVEVVPQHDIEETCEHLTWDDAKERLRGNVGPDLFDVATRRGVMVTLSPYVGGNGERPVFLSTRKTVVVPTGPVAGDCIGSLVDVITPPLLAGFMADRGTIDNIINEMTELARPEGTKNGWAHTMMGGPAAPLLRGLTVELAFDATNDDYLDFIDAALQILHTQYYDAPEHRGYLGWIALRFQGQSRAYLSPQSRSTRTCTVEFAMAWRVPELPGSEWNDTLVLLDLIEAEGNARGGIAHWGMNNNLRAADVEAAYPQLDIWRKVRWELTKGGTITTFDSDFTRRCGLSSPPAPPVASRQVWHNEQTAVGQSAGWTDWNVLSNAGNEAKAIVLAPHPDGRMHAVMTGLDDQVWHNEQTAVGGSAPWTDWNYLSNNGNKANFITLAAHPDGRMHAVMAGTDDQIWHNEQTDVGVSAPWTDWSQLSAPGDRAKFIALGAHPDGRMHAIMAGLDGQLYHNEQTGVGVSAGWTGWNYLSNAGNKAKFIALAAHPDGRMHAIMTGLDDQLWHNEQTDVGVSAGWTDWWPLSNPGNRAKSVVLSSHPDGRMHAVMAGMDDQIWHNEQTAADVSGGWTDWHELSNAGNRAKFITLATHADGRMHAVMADMDDQIWHNEQTSADVSGPWTDWHELSGAGDEAMYISLAGHADGRMHAVMVGRG